MEDKLVVDAASQEDAAAVAEIYAHYVLEGSATFETEAPSPAQMAERIEKILAGGYPWLVVRDDSGRVLGFAYAERLGRFNGYRFSCETHIYVRHEAVGRGIGTMLINSLIAECERRGYRQAFAMIAGTEPVSVVLHARAGYLPCGTLTGAGWKCGHWTDVFMMQRKLGAGDETLPEEHSR